MPTEHKRHIPESMLSVLRAARRWQLVSLVFRSLMCVSVNFYGFIPFRIFQPSFLWSHFLLLSKMLITDAGSLLIPSSLFCGSERATAVPVLKATSSVFSVLLLSICCISNLLLLFYRYKTHATLLCSSFSLPKLVFSLDPSIFNVTANRSILTTTEWHLGSPPGSIWEARGMPTWYQWQLVP